MGTTHIKCIEMATVATDRNSSSCNFYWYSTKHPDSITTPGAPSYHLDMFTQDSEFQIGIKVSIDGLSKPEVYRAGEPYQQSFRESHIAEKDTIMDAAIFINMLLA
jgi:hypothetical protein